MADGTTPTLGLVKPEVGASKDTWGQKTNDNWDKVDAKAATTNADLAYINGQLAAKADKTYVDSQDAAQNAVIATKADASALAAYAPLNSPALTGNPTAPTPAVADNDTSIATTAFVQLAVSTVWVSYHTTNMTLGPLDAGRMVMVNSGTDTTITVPPDATVDFPVNTRIDILRWGGGNLTVVPGAGVGIVSADGKRSIRTAYSAATLWKQSAGTWALIGDLE